MFSGNNVMQPLSTFLLNNTTVLYLYVWQQRDDSDLEQMK